MKISKARINLSVDMPIGMGFGVAAISGLVPMFALPTGGYQGGRERADHQSDLSL